MEKLPPEVLSVIISLVVGKTDGSEGLDEVINATKVAAYSTVCRAWQPHIEKFTFRYIVLTTARLASSETTSILSPERLQHVRLICVHVEIPHDEVFYEKDSLENGPPECDDCREEEPGVTSEDTASADPPNGSETFTNDIRTLFLLLQQAPNRDDPHIAIRLTAERPYLAGHRNCQLGLFEESQHVFAEELQFIHMKLQLRDGEQLPQLPMISTFYTKFTSNSRMLDPTSICVIASRMIRLEETRLELGDLEKRDDVLRAQIRADLATALERLPKSISKYELSLFRPTYTDETFRPPSIVPPDAPGDILCLALFQLSQRRGVTEFKLKGSFDATVLGPQTSPVSAGTQWADMKDYEITLHPVMPNGEWLTMEPLEYVVRYGLRYTPVDEKMPPGEQRYLPLRREMDPKIMEPFLLSIARAAAKMPCLDFFRLDVPTGEKFRVKYDRGDRELDAEAWNGYEMEAETLAAWREAAKSHGSELRYSTLNLKAFYECDLLRPVSPGYHYLGC